MDGYKHYIRTDANNIVTHRFSDAFEQPQEVDICVATDAGRHYNEPYTNDRGQYIYKWDGTLQVERSQAELDIEFLPIYKKDKIEELNRACNQFILAGFTSSVLGAEHSYDFDYEAQINFQGVKDAFRDGLITEVEWGTKDAGALVHTQTQFNQLWLDAFQFKNQNINKYRQLRDQVNDPATDTPEKVALIVW